MLYTLIGNGNAPHAEILATLASLRSAVEAPDDFWMAFQDPPGDRLSPTVAAITNWLDEEGIYYEVVLPEGADASTEFLKADEFHVARRPLDMLLKVAVHRVQPGEASAILVLSDDLDNDQSALYAIERAVAGGLPVYDLGGQMVQVLLEEEPLTEADAGKLVSVPADESMTLTVPEAAAEVIPVGTTLELTNSEALEESLSTPGAGDFRLPEPLPTVEVESTTAEADPASAPDLTYTEADLEELSRDELKNLVKVQGVTPTDMRSKDSMIEALLDAQQPLDRTQINEAAVAGGVQDDQHTEVGPIERTPDELLLAAEGFMHRTTTDEFVAAATAFPEAWTPMYILRVFPGGERVELQYVPREKVALIETIIREVV